ncbi:MAG: hypothetical protein NT076_00430 [Candidatus Pacearchaeota archaeon]|nr:hypothetical protein [Candidatus Pacearchaeota archaeon]
MFNRLFAVRAIPGVDRKKDSKTIPRNDLINIVAAEIVQRIKSGTVVMFAPPIEYITGNCAVIGNAFVSYAFERPEIIHTKNMTSKSGSIRLYKRLLAEMEKRQKGNIIAVGYSEYIQDFGSWYLDQLGCNSLDIFEQFGESRCIEINRISRAPNFFGAKGYFDGQFGVNRLPIQKANNSENRHLNSPERKDVWATEEDEELDRNLVILRKIRSLRQKR